MVLGLDCAVGGARLGFLVLQDTAFLLWGLALPWRSKEAVLGDGDWALAADLLNDVRQNCFCIT